MAFSSPALKPLLSQLQVARARAESASGLHHHSSDLNDKPLAANGLEQAALLLAGLKTVALKALMQETPRSMSPPRMRELSSPTRSDDESCAATPATVPLSEATRRSCSSIPSAGLASLKESTAETPLGPDKENAAVRNHGR